MSSHHQRMMQIINETFATRKDPDQLQVTHEDVKKLQALHHSTLSEYNDGQGPAVWLLLIPTTNEIMKQFMKGKISENQVLQLTNPGDEFETIYLCSVTTLPEHRGKGITTQLIVEAIDSIRQDYHITSLFVWPFTEAGKRLAEKIAKLANLVLYVRSH